MNWHTFKCVICAGMLSALFVSTAWGQEISVSASPEQQKKDQQKNDQQKNDQQKTGEQKTDQEINGLQTKIEEQKPDIHEVQRAFNPDVKPEAVLLVYDPWSGMNRAIYDFNAIFDDYVFLPTTRAYRAITPDPVENGVSNFFSNLSELGNLFNNLLQLRIKDSGVTAARFVVNSTVGILGFWDPASNWGLYEKPEDLGQTLGYWGVGSGPYLVVPFMGPSSLRDASGLGVDALVRTNVDLLDIGDDENKDGIRVATYLLMAIDARKNTGFRYYNTGSPFEYELVRYAHQELRKVQIKK